MEYLSRYLIKNASAGLFSGVKLALTAPVISHIFYADDVMVMGLADRNQVCNLINCFQDFSKASGLFINPNKSSVWFSARCEDETKLDITRLWGANLGNLGEKYLGVYIDQPPLYNSLTSSDLITKFQQKLGGWKANLLSHAGRLILLKSVLCSIPVYHFAVSLLPKNVTQKLLSIMRKFFWGKEHQNRFMALIGWDKLEEPWENGGLNVRNLNVFNQALMLKNVWAMASRKNVLWVKVVHAKYCPSRGLWGTNTSRGGSKLWKDIQFLKSALKNDIWWEFGDGSSVPAQHQPWFSNWDISRPRIVEPNLMVSDLIDDQTTKWNRNDLKLYLGQRIGTSIMNAVDEP